MDWWEGVNLGASVVTCLSFLAAVISWNLSRYRIMDGLIAISKVPSRLPYTKVRVQNVGGCGILIQSIWFRGHTYTCDDETAEPRNVLMPGEYFHIYVENDKDLVLFYTTYNNVNVRHIDQYRLDAIGVVPSRIKTYVRPDIKTRKAMRYKGGELFKKTNDIAPQRRTIKARKPKTGDALDQAISWLDEHGYHAIRGGIS